MIKTIIADKHAENEFICALRERNAATDRKVTETVSEILNDVRLKGDEAAGIYVEIR